MSSAAGAFGGEAQRWYQPVAPPPSLDRVLACSWSARPSGRHRLVPDACIDVLWLSTGSILLCGPEHSAWFFQLPDGVVAVGVLVHMALSLVYALLLAFIIHRWGLIVGILGGALFGLAIYVINYYTFTYLFPWFFPLRSWLVLATHVFFGATAGGIYEALERHIYVLDEPPSKSRLPA